MSTLSFGEALRKARKQTHLSQKELADKCNLSHMTIRRYESNDSFPSLKAFYEISEILPYDYLFNAWIEQHTGQRMEGSMTYEQASAAVALGEELQRHEIIRTAEKAHGLLLSSIWSIVLSLQRINDSGKIKACESVQMIEKIPEYQSHTKEED